MVYRILLILFISIISFYILNILLFNNEYFCYGNDFCNGNKKSALCINQKCFDCGLQSKCKNDIDCFPSLCKEGCCMSQ